MHSKSYNIKMMINDNTDEFIEELSQSLPCRKKTSMKGSDSLFDCVNLLYYKCHKINFK